MLVDVRGTNQLTRPIIGCAIAVHKAIGPGVFESVYRECMYHELSQQKLQLDRERPVPLIYKGVRLKSKFYIDLLVEGQVALELKAVTALAEIHRRQLLTQLKLTGLQIGLLINFNVVILVDGGVRRVINPASRASQVTETPKS